MKQEDKGPRKAAPASMASSGARRPNGVTKQGMGKPAATEPRIAKEPEPTRVHIVEADLSALGKKTLAKLRNLHGQNGGTLKFDNAIRRGSLDIKRMYGSKATGERAVAE